MSNGLTAQDWFTAAGVVAGALLVAGILQRLTRRSVEREDGGHAVAVFVGRMVALVVFVAGAIYGLSALGVRIAPLLGAVGIGGLAIAFAAQSILQNLFASVMLQMRRPFRRGDQIATGDHEGTVVEVNFRTVVLRTFEGSRVLIPASEVLDNPIVNYTARGLRRTTLEVGVAFDTDLEKAQLVLVQAAREAEGVLAHPSPEAWVEELAESAVQFAVRFWHAPDQATMWRVRSAVAIELKRALDAAGIVIPFPQRVVQFPEQ